MKNRLKQRVVPELGAFTEAFFNTLPFLSIINFVSILAVLYSTTYPYIKTYAQWMSIWVFMLFAVVLAAASLVLVYKFVTPSLWAFRERQMSVIMDKLNEIEKRLKEEK